MKFHEDVIFKSEGQKYGSELIEIMNIKGKIIEVQPTEYMTLETKIYRPDLVFELEDKIINLEFQSTKINTEDERRFRLYTALIDSEINKSTKNIETHVLSTAETEKTKIYKINPESKFPTYIHSLQIYNANEFLNKMNTKIKNEELLSKKDLLMISLLCFMQTDNIEQTIVKSAETIIQIKCLEKDIAQFVKGIILIVSDKFITDKRIKKYISELMGERMKIIDDYIEGEIAVRVENRLAEFEAKVAESEAKVAESEAKVAESERKLKGVVINLYKKGFTLEEIAETANVNLDFVKQTLSK